MADNVNVTAGSGTSVAADEVIDGTLGTVKVQYVKLMDGTLDGTTKGVIGSAGLKVDLSGTAANSTAIKVDGSSVTQPVSYSTTGSGTSTGALRVELPTNGTGVIGTVSSVTALGTVTPGTAASSLGKAEDAAHASGDVGVMALAVRSNTAASTSGTDGDYQPLITNTSGHLWVDASGQTLTVGSHAVTNAGTFSVQESGSALTALQLIDDTVVAQGTALGSVKNSMVGGSVTTSAPSYTTGTIQPLSIDTAGSLRVTGGTQYNIDSVMSATATTTVAGARRTDTLTTLTEADGDVSCLRVSSTGALHVTGGGGGTQYNVDQIAPAANTTTMAGVIRDDSLTTLTEADGDVSNLRVNSTGALYVTGGGGGTQYVEDAVADADPTGTIPILVRKDTPAAVVSADGDNIAQRGTNYGAAYVTLLDTGGTPVSVGGGTQYTEDAAAAANPIANSLNLIREDARAGSLVSADGDNVAARGTNYGELYVKHVDTIPVTQSGTWTVQPGNTANTTAWKVDASSVAVPVTDNSGSLTVDNAGTFAVQATIASGATAIAKAEDVASADADVGVPAMAVRKATPANTSGTDGDYEMLQMSAGRLWTSSTIDAALPAGTNGIGKLTSNSGVTIGAVEIASAQTLGTVTTVSTVTNQSQEGGVAISLNAGAVDSGTRRVIQANGAGKTILSAGGSASTSGNNTLVAAGTNKLKVFAFTLSTTSTTAMTCIFQSGASGTELWRCILQAPSSVSTGANLSVSPPAWLFATGSATLLNLNLSSANAVHWSVSYFDEA